MCQEAEEPLHCECVSQGINCCSRLYCAAVLAAIAVLIFNNLLQILLTHFVKINIFCKHENFEANKLGCNKKLQWTMLQHFLTLNYPNIEMGEFYMTTVMGWN